LQDPEHRPQEGAYIPPRQSFQVTSDIPPDSPLHHAPQQPSRRREGIAGGIIAALLSIWAWGKYALLFVFKFKLFATFFSMLLSFGAYTLWLGPWAALGLVVMIFVHEMGHVVEIRRQGMPATAPIFIPFVGAAIFQRSHPTSAINQALIGIAGPIAGTLGAVVALVLYTSTHWTGFLLWAHFGFLINLFNLIPFGMLDGGWILAPASKWFQVAGLAVIVGLLIFAPVSPILLLIVLLGLPMVYERFRNPAADAYLTAGPLSSRYAIAGAWLVLVIYLSYAFLMTEGMLRSFVR